MARVREGTKPSSPRPTTPSVVTGFRSVLVPIDLQPLSDRVLARLSLLPLADDARVTILHVVPAELPVAARRDAEREVRKALSVEARHLRKSLPMGVAVEPLVAVGAVAKEVASHATDSKADLIVMGRGGGRALRDAFLGSTAERVVRQSRLPVLVVRLPARAAYGRPSLALDLDQTAHEAIRVMLLMVSQPRPRVTVIHAYTIPHVGRYYPSLSGNEFDAAKEQYGFESSRDVAALLRAALAELNIRPEDGPEWKTIVRFGPPRTVVANAVKKNDADLLILGTRGRRGAAYVFLGTVAGDMLRTARCDVLMVPPADSQVAEGSVKKAD